MFTIDVSNWNIELGGTGSPFSSEAELKALADGASWTREDVQAIWNSFAGVAPFGDCKPVKRFRNRPFGIKQIWKAIQRLADPQVSTPQPKAEKPAKARKSPKKAKAQAKPKAKRESERGQKGAELIRLVSREKGASIEELMEKLGWQRHTVRGRISTLNSKGSKIQSEKTEGRGLVYTLSA